MTVTRHRSHSGQGQGAGGGPDRTRSEKALGRMHGRWGRAAEAPAAPFSVLGFSSGIRDHKNDAGDDPGGMRSVHCDRLQILQKSICFWHDDRGRCLEAAGGPGQGSMQDSHRACISVVPRVRGSVPPPPLRLSERQRCEAKPSQRGRPEKVQVRSTEHWRPVHESERTAADRELTLPPSDLLWQIQRAARNEPATGGCSAGRLPLADHRQ